MIRRCNIYETFLKYKEPSVLIGILYAIGAYWYYEESSLSVALTVMLFLSRVFAVTFIVTAAFFFIDKYTPKVSALVYNEGNERNKISYVMVNTVEVMVFYLPLLIIKYPGAMCWDTWDMLHQYRTDTITTHHSVFYTAIIGKIVHIFESYGSANVGLFIIVLSQCLLFAFSFGYSINLMHRMGLNKRTITIIKILWLLNPCIIEYVGVAMKDMPYCYLMILLTAMLMDINIDSDSFFKTRYKPILLCTVIIFSCLIRKNGIYVAIALLAVVLVTISLRKYNKLLACLLLISIVCFTTINASINHHYDAEKSSIGEALSIPFQQTARFVKHHKGDVKKEEAEIINSVLEYDSLEKIYNPQKSDNVKGTYKGDNSKLPNYFVVWAKHLARHPECYVAAYFEQYYYVFFPKANKDNIVIYKDVVIGYEAKKTIDIRKKVYYEPIFKMPKELKAYRAWIVRVFRASHYNFLLGIFSNIAINVLLSIIVFCKMKKDKILCMQEFVPAIVALLFALSGPAIYGHPRYLFPIVYSLPLLIVYFMYCYRKES